MSQLSFNVSVLLHRDGGAWVAQGLEYDIAAQGKTELEARERFASVFAAYIHDDLRSNREPLVDLDEAPPRFWSLILGGLRELHLPILVRHASDGRRVRASARFVTAEAP